MGIKHLGALLCILPLLTAVNTSAEIYRVVDERGKVTYTDQPPPEKPAEPLNLPEVNTQPAVQPAPTPADEAAEEPGNYQRAEIVKPRQDDTVPPGQLDVVVQVALEPALKPGHSVLLLFDGSAYGDPVAGTDFVLGGLFRGAHQVQAQVLDEAGEVLIQTAPVTFHVKRHSVLHGQ